MKPKIKSEESWGKAPALFAVLMAINVASYALCVPMMVKILEARETSIFSIIGMLVLTVFGMLLAGKLGEKKHKGVGYALGALLSLMGIVLCALDAVDALFIPGPTVMATATGDSLFLSQHTSSLTYSQKCSVIKPQDYQAILQLFLLLSQP